jgi:hypothetical protein
MHPSDSYHLKLTAFNAQSPITARKTYSQRLFLTFPCLDTTTAGKQSGDKARVMHDLG